MALIIYPTTDYDSFCSLIDANTIISQNVPTEQRKSWESITDDLEKEIYLRQATSLILTKVATLPSTLETNLKKATALLANYSVGLVMTDEGDKPYIKRKKIDDLETEYFAPPEPDSNFPDFINALLKDYNISSSGSFSLRRG